MILGLRVLFYSLCELIHYRWDLSHLEESVSIKNKP